MITVIGDVMLDVYEQLKITRISPEAPVPVGLFQERNVRLGGSGKCSLQFVIFEHKSRP